MFRKKWIWILIAAAASSARGAELELLRTDTISTSSGHNAFSSLTRYKNQFYCVWREGTTHTSTDGIFRIMRSMDGTNWVSAASISRPGKDLRDPQIEAIPDGRLMIHGVEKDTAYRNVAWFSTDGINWTSGTYIAEDDIWFWKTAWFDGKGYGIGYSVTGNRILRLYSSTNATTWTPLVNDLGLDGTPSEASIAFMTDGTAYCLVRRDGTPDTALLGTAQPPYTDWTWKDTGTSIASPDLIRFYNGQLLAGVRFRDSTSYTALCWVDPVSGQLTKALEIPPANTDVGYPGLCLHNDKLWVSYYSGTQSASSIYLAEVAATIQLHPTAIIRNYGNEYPTTDGDFIRVRSGDITEGAAYNDRGTLPTRIITDVGTGLCQYKGYLASATIAEAIEKGFVIKAKMYDHVADDPVDWAIMLDYNDTVNDKRIALQFGSDTNGYTIVKVGAGTNGGSYTNVALAMDDYELRYDIVADNMDLLVNGNEVLSDIGFVASYADEGGSSLRWGSNSTPDSGESHWNLVEYSIFGAGAPSIHFNPVKISWPSVSNALYQVQYALDSAPSNWLNYGSSVMGTGSTNSIFATGSADRTYRVVGE